MKNPLHIGPQTGFWTWTEEPHDRAPPGFHG